MFNWVHISPIANILLNAIIIILEFGVIGVLLPMVLNFVAVSINEFNKTLKEIFHMEDKR